MGVVNFLTTVNKTVDIDKTVNLDVNKTVVSSVQLQGSLATAEASADALGADTGTGGGFFETLNFLVDGGADTQLTVANGLVGPTTAIGTAPGPVFPEPDGATFLDTDIPVDPLRTFTVDLVGGGGVEAGLSSNLGRLGFSNDVGTDSNQVITYERISGDPFSLILPGADLTDPNNALVIRDVIFNPGEPSATSTQRVEIVFTDVNGEQEAGSIALSDNFDFNGDGVADPFLDGQDLIFPLGTFTGDLPVGVQGDNLFQGVKLVGDDAGNPALDFTQIVSIEIRLLDDPVSGSFEDNVLALFENPSTGGVDVSVDEIAVISRQFVPGGGGVLAETDTFAQVSPEGAFSFGEALAAANYFDFVA
jgi:hypothetical protein